ncbi:hypothetical protein [Paraburkholderia sp. RAU2J]|uniref:hypothetical protein n=1 Tax=Paraburkholderia sp. RAU2J TaxID=1938810 RepID=UPI0011C45B6C|nr:hypothetical protein [Paraburkholderia sp. RAU2J]
MTNMIESCVMHLALQFEAPFGNFCLEKFFALARGIDCSSAVRKILNGPGGGSDPQKAISR